MIAADPLSATVYGGMIGSLIGLTAAPGKEKCGGGRLAVCEPLFLCNNSRQVKGAAFSRPLCIDFLPDQP